MQNNLWLLLKLEYSSRKHSDVHKDEKALRELTLCKKRKDYTVSIANTSVCFLHFFSTSSPYFLRNPQGLGLWQYNHPLILDN